MKFFAVALFLLPVFLFSEKMMTEDEFKKTLYEGEKKEGEIVDVAQEEDDTEDLSKVGLKDLEKGCSLKEESFCVELAKRCDSGAKDACTIIFSMVSVSCENKDADACIRLHTVYDEGFKSAGEVIIKVDHKRAVNYAKKACVLSADYCSILGTRYFSGTQVQKVDAEAGLFLSDKACSSGNFLSCYLIGDAYSKGALLKQNNSLAFKYYLKSCEFLPLERICGTLGYSYEIGKDVPASFKNALKFYEILCENGDADYCLSCGNFYFEGKGVSKDLKKAFSYTERACELGSGRGCSNLGLDYFIGQGVTKDVIAAAVAFKKGCELKISNACFNLGVIYQDGEGVPKSIKLAKEFLFKASIYSKQNCDSGDKSACEMYRKLYDMGFGVEDVN
mgnify:CR=1 FL=1